MKKNDDLVAVCTASLLYEDRVAQEKRMSGVDVTIISKNGSTLRGYLEGPASAIEDGETCPLIILMHGLMDSGEFELIRKQADSYKTVGYAVLAVDFNGHGRSDGKLIDMTVSRELHDAEAIFAYAKQLPFVSEIILIGHSQGGIIASITAARHSEEINHLVLLAPAGALSDIMRAGSFFGQSFDPSNPPEKLMAFDDYVGRDYIMDVLALDPYGMAEGYTGHPILLIGGSEDPLVNSEVIEEYGAIYRKPEYHNEVVYKVIDGAPHDFYGFEEQLSSMVLEFLGQE